MNSRVCLSLLLQLAYSHFEFAEVDAEGGVEVEAYIGQDLRIDSSRGAYFKSSSSKTSVSTDGAGIGIGINIF